MEARRNGEEAKEETGIFHFIIALQQIKIKNCLAVCNYFLNFASSKSFPTLWREGMKKTDILTKAYFALWFLTVRNPLNFKSPVRKQGNDMPYGLCIYMP